MPCHLLAALKNMSRHILLVLAHVNIFLDLFQLCKTQIPLEPSANFSLWLFRDGNGRAFKVQFTGGIPLLAFATHTCPQSACRKPSQVFKNTYNLTYNSERHTSMIQLFKASISEMFCYVHNMYLNLFNGVNGVTMCAFILIYLVLSCRKLIYECSKELEL